MSAYGSTESRHSMRRVKKSAKCQKPTLVARRPRREQVKYAMVDTLQR